MNKEAARNMPQPRTILVNAVSAKFGGARTVVEDFLEFAKRQHQINFVFLTGFQAPTSLPDHIHWEHKPLNGASAAFFTIVGVIFYYIKYRCTTLLSFNNMNSVFAPSNRRITYFHQLKVLDASFKESKVRIMRWYLGSTRERIIVQTYQVRDDFIAMFGNRHPISIIWPGVSVPDQHPEPDRKLKSLLIPVANPRAPHKNFDFVIQTAAFLGKNWEVLVTSDGHDVDTSDISNIQFIGVQPRLGLVRRYREATCILMASTHETVGLPIFEALATNTPVVAFEASYIRSFRETFGITAGLEIAATPSKAAQYIKSISEASPNIEVARDFRLGEWDRLLEHL